jgi:hypothetical protein
MARVSDPWQDPSAKRWARHVVDDMVPKLESSAMSLSLVPDNDGDVKFWVELGAAIMLDKPVIAVIFSDREVPPKLEAVADEIVRLPEGVNPAASQALAAAIERVQRKLQ